MKIGVRVTVQRKGGTGKFFSGFERRMKGPHAVKVGFPAGTTGRHPGGMVDIVQIAIWNHFGTAGSGKGFSKTGPGGRKVGGFGGPIPPRPFITVAVFRHRRQIRELLKKIYVDILHGRTTAEIGLRNLGLFGAGIIQETIARGGFAPNSPLTVQIKGSSKPLIDDGTMRGAVTWAYDASGQMGTGRPKSGGGRPDKAFGRALTRMFGSR